MFNPLMNLIKACSGLHFPLLNYNMYSVSNNLSGRAMSSNLETKKEQDIIEQPGNWIGGKPKGTLKVNKNEIIIKVNKKTQKVSFSDFRTQKEAEIYGNNILFDLCKEAGKLDNQYRYSITDSDAFLEVKIGKSIIKVDVQFKDIIEKFEWNMNEKDKSVYRKEGRNKVKLENELTGLNDSKMIFTKLDGNIFNYRLSNLKNLTLGDDKVKKN